MGELMTSRTDPPTPPQGSLSERYASVRDRIARAAQRAGTDPRSVVLVAVTKTAEPDQIRELIKLGHVDFGENRVQQLVQRATIIDEWLHRQRSLPGTGWKPPASVRWHMIGHLQRNKAKKVLEICRLIHSVDSLRLAEEIQALTTKREQPIDVLLQVNMSGEESKSGCAPAAAIHLAEQIDTMLNVRIRGVMTMAPLSANPDDARWCFARCRDLFHEIRDAGIAPGNFNILSMGMSSDFEIAIEEGSNLVRIGSSIFGEAPAGSPPPIDVIDDEEGEEDESSG
jgi:pyridoxal phosphate enzyme (YggS family)